MCQYFCKRQDDKTGFSFYGSADLEIKLVSREMSKTKLELSYVGGYYQDFFEACNVTRETIVAYEALLASCDEVKRAKVYYSMLYKGSTIENVEKNLKRIEVHKSKNLSDYAEQLVNKGAYGEISDKLKQHIEWDVLADELGQQGWESIYFDGHSYAVKQA